MPPFRNPFGRKPPVVNGATAVQNENTPPTKLSGDDASQRSDYASSRASSSLSIKKRDEPSEYKLSALSSRKEKLLVPLPNIIHNVKSSQFIERERAFLHLSGVFRFLSQVVCEQSSLSAASTPAAANGHDSLDLRANRPPRSSIKDLERPQPTTEEAFEDVGLDDEAKQQPPKKRSIFARFGDNSDTANPSDGPRPTSSHRGFHLPGRKRGQSGQGAELGNITNINRPPAPVIKDPEEDVEVR
ncbi:MAG: hypothetical protein LQ346_005437 [Caloplaca aetnensis]|nr:MAG: hypothetical protein LQ346_005437 [Caloplaca aetnensis]